MDYVAITMVALLVVVSAVHDWRVWRERKKQKPTAWTVTARCGLCANVRPITSAHVQGCTDGGAQTLAYHVCESCAAILEGAKA